MIPITRRIVSGRPLVSLLRNRLFCALMPLIAAVSAAAPVYAQAPGGMVFPINPNFVTESRRLESGKSYRTSWLGNTFSDVNRVRVQNFSEALFVTPDGTAFTNAYFDEGGQNVTAYKDGKIIGWAEVVGGAFTGGMAVAANQNYLFVAQSYIPSDTGLRQYGITRCVLNPQAHFPIAPLPGATGSDATDELRRLKAFKQVNTFDPGGASVDKLYTYHTNGVRGLAASATHVFAIDPVGTGSGPRIVVYDATTMDFVTDWSVPRAESLSYDAATQTLWVLQDAIPNAIPAVPATVVRYSVSNLPTVTLLSQQITLPAIARPTSISIAPNCPTGRLLIADDGPNQQVLVYNTVNTTPAVGTAIGEEHGIFSLSAPPGAITPLRFFNLSGVGIDNDGSVYVGSGDGQGLFYLQSYGANSVKKWEVKTTIFGGIADADPTSDTDLYSHMSHYVMDYSRPIGQEWQWQAYTVDKISYPQDPRVNESSNPLGTRVVRLGGRKFLFAVYGRAVYFFRFDEQNHGEIAIPSAMICTGNRTVEQFGTWPPDHPVPPAIPSVFGWWTWRDTNGDGSFQSNEYKTPDPACMVSTPTKGIVSIADGFFANSWVFDKYGNLWSWNPEMGLMRFQFQGFDNHFNPIFDPGTHASYTPYPDLPVPFTNVETVPGTWEGRIERMAYDPVKDRMYLFGSTASYPASPNSFYNRDGIHFRNTDGARLLACYDCWTEGNRVPRWIQPIPKIYSDKLDVSITVAGDYLFMGFFNGFISVFHTDTGERLNQTITPDPYTVGVGILGLGPGGLDMPQSLSSFKRADGEYIILAQGNTTAKTVVYRWQPPLYQVAPGGGNDPNLWFGSFKQAPNFGTGSIAYGIADPNATHPLIDTYAYLNPLSDPNPLHAFPLNPFEMTSRYSHDRSYPSSSRMGTPNLYQFGRTGGDLTFTFPDENLPGPALQPYKWYKVRLHFNEPYWGVGNLSHTTGVRLADIYLNNVLVANNYDIVARAGGSNTAVIEDFMVPASAEGTITLELARSATSQSDPIVEGIEILPVAAETYQIRSGFSYGNDSFSPDQYFVGGNGGVAMGTPVDRSGVTQPASVAVYNGNRTGDPFSYELPNLIPGAWYRVRLHFDESWWGGYNNAGTVGQRVMDITINEHPVTSLQNHSLTGYDTYVAAGGANKAIVEDVLATADTDGKLRIHFARHPGSYDTPEVRGIEVVPFVSAVYQIAAGQERSAQSFTDPSNLPINEGIFLAGLGAFTPDIYFTGGQPAGNTNPVDSSYASNPAPPAVYSSTSGRTERVGGNFSYILPHLNPGNRYVVRLHFVEKFWGVGEHLNENVGKRIMNVHINGQCVLSNFDIFYAAGAANRVVIKEFEAHAQADGTIEINFTGIADSACVSGIEVLYIP